MLSITSPSLIVQTADALFNIPVKGDLASNLEMEQLEILKRKCPGFEGWQMKVSPPKPSHVDYSPNCCTNLMQACVKGGVGDCIRTVLLIFNLEEGERKPKLSAKPPCIKKNWKEQMIALHKKNLDSFLARTDRLLSSLYSILCRVRTLVSGTTDLISCNTSILSIGLAKRGLTEHGNPDYVCEQIHCAWG